MTIMKNEHPSGHAAALLNQMLEVLMWADRAPRSPISEFHPVKERREIRRAAARMRDAPAHENLAAQVLAGICERTVRRDAIAERAYIQFKRLHRELGRVLEENDPEERKNLDAYVDEIRRRAMEDGPDSPSRLRYEHLRVLGWFSEQHKLQKRRQKSGTPRHLPLVMFHGAEGPLDPSEAEVPFPDPIPGPARVFFRIRPDGSQWMAISDRAYESVNAVYDLPDGNALAVSAKHAGIIIDPVSRTVVEELDAKVVEMIGAEDLTFFVIHRDDGRLEGFGKTGRLWKTDPICTAEFRNHELTDELFFAEAPCSCGCWIAFTVDVATGEVQFAEESMHGEGEAAETSAQAVT